MQSTHAALTLADAFGPIYFRDETPYIYVYIRPRPLHTLLQDWALDGLYHGRLRWMAVRAWAAFARRVVRRRRNLACCAALALAYHLQGFFGLLN